MSESSQPAEIITDLPPQTTSFNIDVVGEDSHTHFKAICTYKRPTLLQKGAIRATFRRMLRNQDMSGSDKSEADEIMGICYMMAHIKHSVKVECDEWKRIDGVEGLLDMNVLNAIYEQIESFEANWEKQLING